jgi:hypothetical protein
MATNIEYARSQVATAAALAASGSSIVEFYFPTPVRVKRYWAVPSVAEAAHATQVLDVTFVDAGTAGAGSTTLAVLTNDTDLADSTTRESGAWAAHDAKEVNTEARPVSAYATDVADYLAAGTVVKVTVAKAAGTATGNVLVGIDYVPST